MVKVENGQFPNGVRRARGFRVENGNSPSFSSAFVTAARSCGVQTLTEFSRGADIRIDVLSLWVHGRAHPSPENMDIAVSYLRQRGAEDEVIEGLSRHYEAYRRDRQDRYQKRNKDVAKKTRIDPHLPLGRFIDGLADVRDTTVTGLSRLFGLDGNWLNHIRVQKDMPQETFLKVLEALGRPGILTEEEMAQMEEAARNTILQIVEERGRMVPFSPISLKRHQERHQEENPACDIYTGEEAAKMLFITGTAVAQWRKRLKIPHMLLTDKDIASIRHARSPKDSNLPETLGIIATL